MSDDQQRRNERFQQALDDMFGPASSAPEPIVEPPSVPAPEPEPVVAAPPPVTARPASPAMARPPYSAPAKPKRSLRRTLALGCAGAFGLLFLCLVALAVIGLVAGDDEGASAGEPVELFAPTAEPSYTAETGGETPAGITPIGTYVEISPDWRVAVIGVTPDATDLVMAENQFNDPPVDGRQFFMAMVSVENTGDEAAYFPAGVLFRAVNGTGREYTTFDDYCGVVPDWFPYEEVLAGNVVSGNVCWSVMREDAGSIAMRSIAYLDGFDQHHFSLQQ